jgi:hypothetical protein
MARVTDEWWDDQDAVDSFRLFIASSIRIHIINILKCNEDPLISNTPALNEVKTLDYITRDLQLSHYNETNFANEINLLQSTEHGRGRGRGRSRGRGRGRDRGFRGHGGGFGRN